MTTLFKTFHTSFVLSRGLQKHFISWHQKSKLSLMFYFHIWMFLMDVSCPRQDLVADKEQSVSPHKWLRDVAFEATRQTNDSHFCSNCLLNNHFLWTPLFRSIHFQVCAFRSERVVLCLHKIWLSNFIILCSQKTSNLKLRSGHTRFS